MSEPIQAISQNNYILQAPSTSSTMFTTELEYDGDKISGYAGSAFKAGTDLEFGYTEADTISSINTSSISDVSLNNIVQTNSASWGGNALPISAGPGVKINFVNNTLVFSNDETVLWEGTLTVGNTAQMTEPVSAFESYKLYLLGYERKLKVVNEFWTDGSSTGNEPYKVNPIIFQAGGGFFTINAGDCIWNTAWNNLQYVTGYNKWMPYTESTWNQIDTSDSPTIVKIVGINRK